ncbi:hypothetical protein F0Q34_21495 [Pseudoroseomonas oryzae]|uniref:Uncharacterized protein n=1 Tax=Teichococcus oryzae TaxID=1608942 RepID=A0A5B2TAN7_9PROT|nr:hypothetical protein F0Q34_21495 [Pseudoroseomonas oryzae]
MLLRHLRRLSASRQSHIIGRSLLKGVRSDPDGHVLLFDSPGHIINPMLQPDIPINYETSFSYISGVTIQPWVWIVSAEHAAKDLQSFVAESREKGSPVIFGSSGIGSAEHLAGELLG